MFRFLKNLFRPLKPNTVGVWRGAHEVRMHIVSVHSDSIMVVDQEGFTRVIFKFHAYDETEFDSILAEHQKCES